jgi:hypothetical protein
VCDGASRTEPGFPQQKRRVVELSLANAFWLMTIDALAGVLFMFIAWSSADWLAQEISAYDYDDFWCEPLRKGVIFIMNQVRVLLRSTCLPVVAHRKRTSLAECMRPARRRETESTA